MSKKKGKKTVSKTIRFALEDVQSIAAAAAEFWWKDEAEIIRTAIRVGLRAAAKDPSLMGPRPVDPEEITPPQPVMRKGKPTS